LERGRDALAPLKKLFHYPGWLQTMTVWWGNIVARQKRTCGHLRTLEDPEGNRGRPGFRGVDRDNPGVKIIHRGKHKFLSRPLGT
jgi:hypothetical protein